MDILKTHSLFARIAGFIGTQVDPEEQVETDANNFLHGIVANAPNRENDVGVERKKDGDDEEKQTHYSYDDLFNPPLGNRLGYRC